VPSIVLSHPDLPLWVSTKIYTDPFGEGPLNRAEFAGGSDS
jgi:hypothetical protein